MRAIITVENLASDIVSNFWTPLFVAAFIAIVVYALWPSNKASFDEAASMPLRED